MGINTIKELLDLGYSIAEIEKIGRGAQPDDAVTEQQTEDVAGAMGAEAPAEQPNAELEAVKEELKTLKEALYKQNIQKSDIPEKEESTLDILNKFVR